MNNAIFEKEKIVVWSVTVQDVYLGRNLVRPGDFKIRHKAFSQDLVYLTFTLVFHGCHYSRVIRIKLSAAPTVPGDAGRGRLGDISATSSGGPFISAGPRARGEGFCVSLISPL